MKKVVRFLSTHKQFTLFFILAIGIVGIAVFAPFIAPKDPYEAIMTDSLSEPGGSYIWGADRLGRDLLSRVIFGTRSSLVMSLCLVIVVFLIGTFLGVIAGFFGGAIDQVIMRFADMMVAFPGLVLAIAIAGIMGAGIVNAIVAIAAVTWPKYARLARSLVIKIKCSLYVEAAVLTGTSTCKILVKYILPNMLTPLVITATTDIGAMMMELAALSFLGFGAQAPTPEWGLMLNEGRTYITMAPWLMIYPGIAIVVTVIVFNMLGDSIRDILDKKQN